MRRLAPDIQSLAYPRRTIQQIMLLVMLALLPGTWLYAWLIHRHVVLNIVIAVIAALCTEALLLHLRQRPIAPALRDGSVIVAAWLLALCVPPTLPAWQLITGVFIMTSLGKHLFGGLGHNPFNPAMVAYCVLLVSFPVTMTDWPVADVSGVAVTAQETATTHSNRRETNWDSITGATALDRLRQARRVLNSESPDIRKSPDSENNASLDTSRTADLRNDYRSLARTDIMGSPWHWISLAWMTGGIGLLLLRIISWHIPVSLLLAVSALYLGYGALVATALPVIPALLSGAIMLGAFFIATDPVTAAASKPGMLVYGAGIGIFTFVIREFSSYPEGLAFAVLLMNLCVPLIDHLSAPASGRKQGKAP